MSDRVIKHWWEVRKRHFRVVARGAALQLQEQVPVEVTQSATDAWGSWDWQATELHWVDVGDAVQPPLFENVAVE